LGGIWDVIDHYCNGWVMDVRNENLDTYLKT